MRRGDDATNRARETALPMLVAAAGWTTVAPVAGDAFAAGLAAGLLAVALLLAARPSALHGTATDDAGRRAGGRISRPAAPAPR